MRGSEKTGTRIAQPAIPNQATVRDIEQGNDGKLFNLQAVAVALGLGLVEVGA